ncbi:MAG: hypothetical protein HRU25_02450 [Psychrobium sp.]|nr:hypothetical protein [Psychrobium sp.]
MIYKVLLGEDLKKATMTSFVMLLVFAGLNIYMDKNIANGSMALIIFVIHSVLSSRMAESLILISNNSMSGVIPNYAAKFRQPLMIMIACSLLPSLLFIENPIFFLGFMTALLASAVIHLLIPQPSYLAFVWIAMIITTTTKPEIKYLVGDHLPQILLFAIPLTLIGLYYLWCNVERRIINTAPKQPTTVATALTKPASIAKLLVSPIRLYRKLSRWSSNLDFNYYRKKLRSPAPMSARQLIATACQSEESQHGAFFVTISIVTVLFLGLGKVVDGPYYSMLLGVVNVFPAMMFILGIMNINRAISTRKNYLREMSIQMPIFSDIQFFHDNYWVIYFRFN